MSGLSCWLPDEECLMDCVTDASCWRFLVADNIVGVIMGDTLSFWTLATDVTDDLLEGQGFSCLFLETDSTGEAERLSFSW